MRAITVSEPGGPEVLTWSEVPDPTPGPGEVLIEVEASAVNRADLLQRQGYYPPPPRAPEYPGLECSGRIGAVGDGVTDWRVGEEVCALLAGGGYAERVVVPAGQVLPVPAGVSLAEAAALPEVFSTVWANVFATGRLAPGEVFLVHGGSGGIGTAAIQVANAYGARVFCTASAGKLDLCRALGAERAIDYRDEDFVEVVRDATDGHGADLILDNMGAKYLPRNVSLLARNGRLVVIGLQGGVKGELNLSALLARNGTITATSLRSRPVAEKAEIVADVRTHLWPLLEMSQVRPVIDRAFALADAADAHRALESGLVSGKVLLIR